MSENLEDLTPNQRRALNKGLAALETMAAMWGAEIRIHDVAQRLSAKPDAERAKAIAAFIEQAFIEGAYRHYLDRDPAANPELERASQPGGGELDLPGLRVAIRAFTPHMHDWISKVIDALERQPGSGEDAARLDFLIDEGAVVDAITTANGEKRYQLTWPDLGESQNAWYSSARIAIDTMIDAARASLDGRRGSHD